MKVLAILVVVAYCSLAMGREQPVEKEKRGASFTTPKTYSAGAVSAAAEAAYVTAKVTPQTFTPSAKEYTQPQYQVKYVQAQQDAAPQYQYEYEQQPYASTAAHQQAQRQQQVTKLAPAKTAYAPAPVHFSLASDVSSFSYSSPLVSYSNLGLLKQTIGKSVEQPTAEQSYAQPQVAQRPHNQYTSDSKVAYAPQQYVAYKQPQKVILQAAPVAQKLTYNAPAHTQKVAYAQPAQPAQRVVYAQVAQAQGPASAQQAYKAGATIVYASSAEEAYEKIYGKPYVAPQQQVYEAQQAQPQHQAQVQTQTQAPAYQGQQQQVQYVKLTPQQYAAYTQQLQQQQHQQQQTQYVEAQAPQYSGSHSEQQSTYVARPQFYQKYATQ